MFAFLVYPWSRTFLPTVLVEVMAYLHIQVAPGGLLSSVYNLGVGISSLAAGSTADRIGPKRTLQIGLLISAISILLTGFATSFAEMVLFAVSTGIGLSFWATPSYLLMAGWFNERRGLAFGILTVAFGFGLFSGPLVASTIYVASGNWRIPFILLAAIALAIAAISLPVKTAKRPENTYPSYSSEADGERKVQRFPFAKLQVNALFLTFSFAAVVVALTQSTFVALFVTYLRTFLSFTAVNAAFAASFFGIGSALGGPLAGISGDRFGRIPVTAAGLGASVGVSYYLFIFGRDIVVISACSFLLGMLLSSFVFLNVLVSLQELFGPQYMGIGTGYFYTLYALSGVPAGYILGYLEQRLGWTIGSEIIFIVIPLICLALIVAVSLANRRRSAQSVKAS